MLEKIKEFIKYASEKGLRLPFAFDSSHNKPSVTLLFMYITFTLSLFSVIVLHFTTNILTATITSLMFWVMATVFYLIRDLSKFKIDLDDKTIDLEGDDKNDDKQQ